MVAPAVIGAVASNPLVQKVGKNIVGKVADKGSQAVLGGIGGAIGGKKGKRVGKAVAKGLSSIRKSIIGFNEGGKVRRTPMQVVGYNAGGVVARPVIRPLPAPRPRKRK